MTASTTLVTGIGELSTMDPDHPDAEDELGTLHDAALVLGADGEVIWTGHIAGARRGPAYRRRRPGRRPAFVDSHTHLVFAGDRSAEFAARMTGAAYDGGGIASTVAATRDASDDALRALLRGRIAEMHAQGTGIVEVKSGYGLDVTTETRLLRLAREVTDEVTFLGGHVVPPEYRFRRDEYVDLVTGPMLAEARAYARWVDVFCEPNSPYAFTEDESRAILLAGRAAGLGLRVHGNQLGPGPGVRLAVELERRVSTTARTSRPGTSTRWPPARPSRRCCPASSSRPATRTRTRGPCSTPGPPSRWPPTATRGPVTRRPCRSSSPSPCASCVSRRRRRCGPRREVRHNRCGETTSEGSLWALEAG